MDRAARSARRSRDHADQDTRRVRPSGRAYAPFHDATVAVDGAAAAVKGRRGPGDPHLHVAQKRPQPVGPGVLRRWTGRRDRWDTRDHADQDTRRVRPSGRAYAPFHDATVAVLHVAQKRPQPVGPGVLRRWTGRRDPLAGSIVPALARKW
jgi:hypothetical protein